MRRIFCALLLIGVGCGTSTDVESQVTITQGLYGQLTQTCSTMGCVGAPREGAPVAWFDRSPYATDGGMNPAPLQEGVSGKNGFYQFALDSNVHGYLAIGELRPTNGVQYFTATALVIPHGLARVDWHAGPGNDGTWTDVR